MSLRRNLDQEIYARARGVSFFSSEYFNIGDVQSILLVVIFGHGVEKKFIGKRMGYHLLLSLQKNGISVCRYISAYNGCIFGC